MWILPSNGSGTLCFPSLAFPIKKSVTPKIPESHATLDFIWMLVKGIEPPAYALRVRCSTPELHQLKACCSCQTKNIIQLSAKNATLIDPGLTENKIYNELYSKQLGEEITFNGYVKKVAHPIKALNEEEKELLNNESSYQFHFMAFYNLHYTIADTNTLTVGDRDYALQTFNTELQSFVDMLSKTELTSYNIRTTLSKKADEIARDLSSESLKLTCEINGIEVHNNGVDSQII